MRKAVRFSRFGGPDVLEIVELADPHPGPGQVRIAVRAAGVGPSDCKKRSGLMDEELPQTMGHEAAGVVDELGEGVTDVVLGDRVFGMNAEGAAQAELAPAGSGVLPELIESGRFSLPDVRSFPLAEVSETHRVIEEGQLRGRLVLVVDPPPG